MEKKNLQYSLKNIPAPSKEQYLKSMIEKVTSLLVRMRWKAHFSENKEKEKEQDAPEINYGFKSEKSPPQNDHLSAFEMAMYELIRNIKFRNHLNDFQKRLKKDVKDITSSTCVFVKADKTTNLYKVPKEHYNKLLTDNITATYKKASPDTLSKINMDAQKIAVNFRLEQKIDKMAKNEAFVTIKDHKDNFPNSIKCRLINPAKSEIGKISKSHLQEINKVIREKTKLNQWQSTSAALDWFKRIPNKKQCRFLQLDIETFYPSISDKLLDRALTWAQSFQMVDNQTIEVIWHCRRSLLFYGKEAWEKTSNPSFDVTMGSFDGAEICELVGLFLLNQMKGKFRRLDFGLYRDDGLGYTSNMTGTQLNRMEKSIHQLFKSNGLGIAINVNLSQVDFLDVTLSLEREKFWPFRKPNSEPLYINKNSNHPPCIIKEIPRMIEKRLSELSSDPNEFEKAKPEYEAALSRSGFNTVLTFQGTKEKSKNRPRNIIWFNPPYNAQVKTNIGRKFIDLLKHHFPKTHKFRKLFNKNSVKLSYSCTKNIESIISSHNKRVLKEENTEQKRTCNCRCKKDCPLDGNCLVSSLVYKAEVTTTNSVHSYIGNTGNEFKERYTQHKNTFKNRNLRNKTTLAGFIWDCKDNHREFKMKWSIVKHGFPYRCGSRRCDLCLQEKLEILQTDRPDSLLNSRNEMITKCPHGRRYKLSKAGKGYD